MDHLPPQPPPQPPPHRPMPPAPLLKAARRLLRPLVRLMLRSGLTFPILADTVRELFVDIAINDILTDPRARTDSRVSLLTGVHRKEIKRLREAPADSAEIPEVVTLVSQIVARWVGSPAFADANGRPRPLDRARRPASGDAPGFDALVGLVTTDVRPRAVLDDLLAHGVVRIDSDDRIQLETSAFIPRPGGKEQLFYFARNLHDHVAAAAANISTPAPAPFLDRSVHYDRLTQDQARELEQYARAAALRVLLDVNRKAIELVGLESAEPVTERHRINFGIYVFGEGDDAPGGAAS